MTHDFQRNTECRWTRGPRALTALFAVAAVTACASARSATDMAGAGGEPDASTSSAGPNRLPHTEADVRFMSGMIPHHAQAVLIAGWAATHGAREDIRILCERIVVAQRDEIAMMQRWLRDRNEPVPAADATHLTMTMNGVEHDMLMPGMLNADELAELDRARGGEFDRLFLMAMIRHHEGALTMVDELYASDGAAQEEDVFRFSSDVWADQTTEIDRMQKMLDALSSGGSRP